MLNAVWLDTLDVSTIQFDAYFEAWGVGIEENSMASGFNLYPNPANAQISIVDLSGNNNANLRYEIVDLTGRVLSSKSLNQTQAETSIDISGIPNAVYLIRILDGVELKEQLRFVKVN